MERRRGWRPAVGKGGRKIQFEREVESIYI
jgi:hypothetical protein